MEQSNKEKKEEPQTAVPLYDEKGMATGTVELDKKVFDGVFDPAILYQAVQMYSANKRVGLASTKVRKYVSGGGKKPWRQKGTGRARVASSRNPLWRGGGVTFGPHPRNFKYQLPKKLKKIALRHSLNSKLKDGEFSVLKDLSFDEPKTKLFQVILNNIKISGKIMFCFEKSNGNLILASRNIRGLSMNRAEDLDAMSVLKNRNFLITEGSLKILTKRLKG